MRGRLGEGGREGGRGGRGGGREGGRETERHAIFIVDVYKTVTLAIGYYNRHIHYIHSAYGG